VVVKYCEDKNRAYTKTYIIPQLDCLLSFSLNGVFSTIHVLLLF
jgi:hypothetical protein